VTVGDVDILVLLQEQRGIPAKKPQADYFL